MSVAPIGVDGRGAAPAGHAVRTLPLAFVLFIVVVGLCGCSARPREIGREPALSDVGSGISPQPINRVASSRDGLKDLHAGRDIPNETGSLWREEGADLFRDARARRPGDILTVTIQIKDKASLDNSSKRSRDAATGFGLDFSHAFALPGLTSEGSAQAQTAVNSNTSTDGKGEIERSESIDLRVAAVVTGVLPNGNLVIQGSQEIRVNYELRVLTFSGIVNIADIKADNTIPYERVAEARMSYGGRGRLMEVQQPGWMQQITDQLTPF